MIEIIPNWHPIFVHFTVALVALSAGLFLVGIVAKCDQAILVAKWNLWFGAAFTVLTLAAGLYAYNSVAHDTPSHEAMTEHRNIALVFSAMLLASVIGSVLAHKKEQKPGALFVALMLLTGAVLASTAWHGGELVYRHGLGVMSLPNTGGHDHAGHGHADRGHGAEVMHAHDAPIHDGLDAMPDDDMGMDDMNMSSTLDEGGDHHHDHGDHPH